MKAAEHTGIWGRSKSGKSTQAKAMIKRHDKVIVFDCLNEYKGIAPVKVSSRLSLLRAMKKPRFKIRYVPDGPDFDAEQELNRLCKILFDVQGPYRDTGKGAILTLVVEEMAECAPNVRRVNSPFQAMCSRGRHYGVQIIGISQRMADVTMSFRGNTNADYFFPLRTDSDFKAAADLCRAANPDAETALKKLTRGNYVFIGNGEFKTGNNGFRKTK